MTTLVDTSVWVEHLRRGNSELAKLLETGSVYCHRFVIGELACGRIRNRLELLGLLSTLPQSPVAEHDEVLNLIADRQLDGRGLGWVDMHLLASALLAKCPIWTFDRALKRAASELKLVSE